MRLWTLHPKYLDARGLVALWREALLAQKVLCGATRGYRHHPQLRRFAGLADPPAGLAAYLTGVCAEAERRGYRFDATKIGRRRWRGKLPETRGQLLYEWKHLKRKMRRRDPRRLRALAGVKAPAPHPLFRIVSGDVRGWEKVRTKRRTPRPEIQTTKFWRTKRVIRRPISLSAAKRGRG